MGKRLTNDPGEEKGLEMYISCYWGETYYPSNCLKTEA
jgi:hypothetical protein